MNLTKTGQMPERWWV